MKQISAEKLAKFVDAVQMGTMGGFFQFRNEFDGVSIVLDNADPCPDGPYYVVLVFEDPAIGSEHEGWEFDTLSAAVEKFQELMKNELRAVLDDGSFI